MITVDSILSERYHLESLLGRGGMADVFRGRDLTLERPVAVKVVRGADDEDARRFAREIRAMAALSHPGIVRLFDAGTHEGVPYLVMELVDGQPLPSVLEAGPLGAARVAELGRELATALAHAHELGIVHRDVKPANVLLGADGRTRLSDFGIAQLADATRLTTPGMTTGTAAYLAPEQLQGGDVGPPADIYALGLVLLEALTGSREYTGTAVEAAMARLQRDPTIPDELLAPWPHLLRAMTDRDPSARPSAGQVAVRLAGRAAQRGAAATPTMALSAQPTSTEPTPTELVREPAPDERARRSADPRRKTTVVVAGLLAVAAVLLLVLATDVGDSEAPPDTPAPEQEAGTTLLPEVDEALRRLEEAVQP